MKHIKKILTLPALALAMGSLAGCGSKFSGVTINFWHTFGKTVTDALTSYANTFAKLVKEHDGVDIRVKLTYKGGYTDVKNEVTKALSIAGNPTLTVAYPDHVADYFSVEKKPGDYVVNLEQFAEDPDIGFGKEDWLGDNHGSEDFIESFYQEGYGYQREGLYSLPFLKSTEVMLYNQDLVLSAMSKIGITPDGEDAPTTPDELREYLSDISWEDFMDLCESFKDHSKEISKDLKWPAFYDSDGNLFISQLYQNDIPYADFDAQGNAYIGFNGMDETKATPEQIQAYEDVQALMKKYYNWHKKGLFETKGVDGQYSSNYLVPGKTMFAIGSCGGSGYSFPSSGEFKVGCVKVPYSNNNPLYVSQGPTLTILNNKKLSAENNDIAVKYAFKFAKYITNDKINATLCTNNSEGYIPVRSSAYDHKVFTDYMASSTDYVIVTKCVLEEVAGQYLNSPVFKGSATLRELVGGALADILKKGSSDAAIKEIIDSAIEQAVLKM